MRLIDADVLKKEVDNFPNCYNGWSDTYDKAYIIEAIEEAPTIEPKRGEWKIEETESVWGKGYLLTCSVCGDTFRVTENALPYEKYCRNCGADMRKESKYTTDRKTEPQTDDKCKGCIYENGDSLMACVSCQGKVPYDGYDFEDEP